MAQDGYSRQRRLSDLLRGLGLAVFGVLTMGLVVATALALAGLVPWIALVPNSAPGPLANAGMWLQLGLTLISFALAYGLTTHLRVARLDPGQRSFAMAIEDVIRARRMTPGTERAGLFAQVGDPDPRLHRTRVFLHRQQTAVEALADELTLAQRSCDDLRRRLDEIGSAEREARQHLEALAAELKAGVAAEDAPKADNVISLAERSVSARRLRAPVRPERPAPRR